MCEHWEMRMPAAPAQQQPVPLRTLGATEAVTGDPLKRSSPVHCFQKSCDSFSFLVDSHHALEHIKDSKNVSVYTYERNPVKRV